jgi:glyoxylase-like metal-dependent hydrolase (beta-lactamase superfamily II)
MSWTYEKGLHDLGGGAYAWLAPDGSWGWSNAGLIVDGDQSLLVDTLFDLRLTQEMLDVMRDAEPRAASRIGTLVNTHANGDHCHGNQLVEGAEIIASAAAAEEMAELPPEAMAALMKAMADNETPLGQFFRKCFGPFEFEGIRHTPPTRTFEGEMSVSVGDKTVELIQVGPAHTRGDVLVHVPGDRTVFTGDILFIDGTPIMWAGPVQRWIEACRRIAEMEVETVVPGHGPITDKRGVAAVQRYLEYVRDESRKRFDAGLDAFEAARDIALGDYASWGDAERIVVNVDRLYREFSGDDSAPDIPTLFGQMAEIAGSRPDERGRC